MTVESKRVLEKNGSPFLRSMKLFVVLIEVTGTRIEKSGTGRLKITVYQINGMFWFLKWDSP